MKAEHIRLPSTASQADIVTKIEELNNDSAVHGMLLQVRHGQDINCLAEM